MHEGPYARLPAPRAGLAVLKEFEDSLGRCTSIYVEEALTKTVPSLVSLLRPLVLGSSLQLPAGEGKEVHAIWVLGTAQGPAPSMLGQERARGAAS